MSKKKIIYITIFLLFLLIASLYLYNRVNLKLEIEEVETKIQKEKELIALIDQQLEAKDDRISDNKLTSIFKQFPALEGYPQLAAQLYSISVKNNVTISSITLDETSQDEKENPEGEEQGTVEFVQTLPITLKVKSDDYESIRSFIEDIHQADRLIDIKDFNIIVQNDIVAGEILLNTYFVPEMKEQIPDLEQIKTYTPENKVDPTY